VEGRQGGSTKVQKSRATWDEARLEEKPGKSAVKSGKVYFNKGPRDPGGKVKSGAQRQCGEKGKSERAKDYQSAEAEASGKLTASYYTQKTIKKE